MYVVLRRRFIRLSSLSLLACAVLVAMWVRSYYILDRLTWAAPARKAGAETSQRRFSLDSAAGGIEVTLSFGRFNEAGYADQLRKGSWGHIPPRMFEERPAG